MSNDLSASIQKLKNSSLRINEITDKASDSFRIVEKFLRDDCKINISAYAFVEKVDDDSAYYLKYFKGDKSGRTRGLMKKEFGIFLTTSNSIAPLENDYIVKHWSNFSRDEKLKSINYLPFLMNEISNQLNKKIDEVGESAEQVFETLAKMTGEEG
ncbi:MAG: hypothetical protein OEZ33_07735 [Gammaproteobacteria bacterium]|nr:hypothetical protein [Gammaproteobacteria bacterium]MDH5778087.1 hypothetical protein [Gammaproteobacteria bacterium]